MQCFLKTILISIFAAITLCSAVFSQDLPDKIRGYKVKKTDITIGSKSAENSEDDEASVEVVFDEPEVANVGLAGITLELGGVMTIFGQSGTVDFITFKDFELNGIKVDIEEYKKSFEFKKKRIG